MHSPTATGPCTNFPLPIAEWHCDVTHEFVSEASVMLPELNIMPKKSAVITVRVMLVFFLFMTPPIYSFINEYNYRIDALKVKLVRLFLEL
jgi:hypothetical protein